MTRHIEHNTQVACCNWFRYNFSRRGWKFVAIPNGGARSAITGSYLKDEGATAGAPDVVLILDGGRTVWVEFKTPKGRVSPSQIAFGNDLKALGHSSWIVRSFDDFRNLVELMDR